MDVEIRGRGGRGGRQRKEGGSTDPGCNVYNTISTDTLQNTANTLQYTQDGPEQ